MIVKDLIEKLEVVSPDAQVYVGELGNESIEAAALMYADEKGSIGEENEGELEFHDGNWGMAGELAILIEGGE